MSDVALVCGEARLELSRLGAEARVWRVGGADLLWPGDPAIWPDVSPVLFPIVGWTRDGVRVNGRRSELDVHGFARRLMFDIEASAADCVTLVARDDEATREAYPFAFEFRVEHRLTALAWEATLEVKNTGDSAMPYACGLHPGFRWPFAQGPREGAVLRFSAEERAEVPVIAPGGLFSRQTRPVPLSGAALALDDALFAREALCFLNAASRSIRFEQADGSALAMAVEDFPHLALWTRPGAPFLSLESWTGYGDPENFVGDLFEKPSMRVLAPGQGARHRAVYSFHPAS